MDEFEELPSDDLFPDEHELKKENIKLKRQLGKFRDEQITDTKKLIKQHEKALRNMDEFYQEQLEDLRGKNRELFEKNLELHETSKIFVKGLEHLRKDGITVTHTETWSRKGVHGSLHARIAQLIMDGKKIVSLCPLTISSQGDTMQAVIVTEHFDKHKRSI